MQPGHREVEDYLIGYFQVMERTGHGKDRSWKEP